MLFIDFLKGEHMKPENVTSKAYERTAKVFIKISDMAVRSDSYEFSTIAYKIDNPVIGNRFLIIWNSNGFDRRKMESIR